MTENEIADFLVVLLGEERWPPPFNLFRAKRLMASGTSPGDAARLSGTTRARAEAIAAQQDATQFILGAGAEVVTPEALKKVRLILGQLLLGAAAERAFEDIYRIEMGATHYRLEDHRIGRTDTDYRLLNGHSRPIYRLNIKFHGARFRRSSEMVGLDPDDCFPLATYKINSALKKQQDEHLPYIFVIVSPSGFNAERAGELLPVQTIYGATLLLNAPKTASKRLIEDRVILSALRANSAPFEAAYTALRTAPWFVLSARRADMLLRQFLFERVFALRVRGFNRTFRAAEVDMHFSLANDLTSLPRFLQSIQSEGETGVASRLERGTF